MMNQQLATATAPRLPMPEGLPDHLKPKWRVLTDAIFPMAKSAAAIELALDYCRVRNLDVMKKPVNIVSMYSSALGRNVETIWPSILEVEITAARTGAWAGMDPPVWGDEIELVLEGERTRWVNRIETKQKEKQILKVPAWCAVTVYRIVGGQRYAFTEPVFWQEAYGRVGNTDLANDMWCKRRRGQLHKVAKAASLRAAFPEQGELTAEEMAGQTIEGEDDAPSPPRPASPPSPPAPAIGLKQQTTPPHNAETGELAAPHHLEFQDDPVTNEPERWREWGARFIAAVETADTEQEIAAWEELNSAKIADMKNENPKLHARLEAAINAHRIKLAATTAGEV
jgi:phage recombination protein Bet